MDDFFGDKDYKMPPTESNYLNKFSEGEYNVTIVVDGSPGTTCAPL